MAAWLAMNGTVLLKRQTDIAIAVTKAEKHLRYHLIAALAVAVGMWFADGVAIVCGESVYCYPFKMAIYASPLAIGLFLGIVMQRWTARLRILAAATAALQEAALTRKIGQSRMAAFIHWATIAPVCFLRPVKPF